MKFDEKNLSQKTEDELEQIKNALDVLMTHVSNDLKESWGLDLILVDTDDDNQTLFKLLVEVDSKVWFEMNFRQHKKLRNWVESQGEYHWLVNH